MQVNLVIGFGLGHAKQQERTKDLPKLVFTIKQFVIRLHNLDILDILVLTSMNKA